ncbi:hypothetical protein BS47DRAFT_1401133 [Hydnum rufescens UP504]|uniref:Uncharacterized protein n=1 Tax=Hydnum rufescens UP504 TaxID=1448309 RepID=A0A9P6AFA9_9AGAM|nr:hypothetical protein BS47DRAFT_1401133 [Hydnum rufescens UP504]
MDEGRDEEALKANEEALSIRRSLAAEQPGVFLPDLARSLSNLSNCLSNFGRDEEALKANEEALSIRRSLAADQPGVFLPDLARSLSNLSNCLSKFGRDEEALKANEEALNIRRSLAADQPRVFLPDLAQSLSNLSVDLSKFGRHEEALKANEEALGIYRSLATDQPEVFRPDIAHSLHNLSVKLSKFGRDEETLKANEEALSIRRSLAADQPGANEEALSIFRSLAADRPEVFRPDLADSLNTSPLPTDKPELFRPDIAHSLGNLSVKLLKFGRREEALKANEQALSIYRLLAADQPQVFRPDLARSLNHLSLDLSEFGRDEEALKANEEALKERELSGMTTWWLHGSLVGCPIPMGVVGWDSVQFDLEPLGVAMGFYAFGDELWINGPYYYVSEFVRSVASFPGPAMAMTFPDMENITAITVTCWPCFYAEFPGFDYESFGVVAGCWLAGMRWTRVLRDGFVGLLDRVLGLRDFGHGLGHVGVSGEGLGISTVGRCFADSGRLLSSGVDPTVKMWDVRTSSDGDGRGDVVEDALAQMHTQVQKLSLVAKVILSWTLHTISAIDHHRTNALFAAPSHGVHIWDETKYTSGPTIFCCGTQIVLGMDPPPSFYWFRSDFYSRCQNRRSRMKISLPGVYTLFKEIALATRDWIMKTHGNALAWSRPFANEEALGIYRLLAADQPEVFRPDLAPCYGHLKIAPAACSLDNLSISFRNCKSTRSIRSVLLVILTTSPLAFGIWPRKKRPSRQLRRPWHISLASGRSPKVFCPDLARSLNPLSLDLSEFGRDEEALKANEEALGIYRLLACRSTRSIRPDLSRSL